jgi:hypothetical protein
MRGLFSVCPHNFSMESDQSSNSHEPFGHASPCPSVLRVQRLDFLWSDSRTIEFGTVIHKGLHTGPSRYWPGSYCCTRILRKANSCPNFSHISMHRLLTFLRSLTNLETLTNHLELLLHDLQYFKSKDLTFSGLTPDQQSLALSSIKGFIRGHLDIGLVAVVVREFCIRQTLVPTSLVFQCTGS